MREKCNLGESFIEKFSNGAPQCQEKVSKMLILAFDEATLQYPISKLKLFEGF